MPLREDLPPLRCVAEGREHEPNVRVAIDRRLVGRATSAVVMAASHRLSAFAAASAVAAAPLAASLSVSFPLPSPWVAPLGRIALPAPLRVVARDDGEDVAAHAQHAQDRFRVQAHRASEERLERVRVACELTQQLGAVVAARPEEAHIRPSLAATWPLAGLHGTSLP